MVTERIRKIIASKGLNVSRLAKMIGIPQVTLNNQMLRRRSISLDTIDAILTSFEDISAEWLIRGTGNMYITDNIPAITGNEQEDALNLHAQIARTMAKLEELERENLKLLNQLEFMENLNFKITGRCHDLERELSELKGSATKAI